MTIQRTPELEDVLRLALANFQSSLHVSLPGRIESYDAATQTANVKPLLKNTFTDDDDGSNVVEVLPVISAVPVVFPRGGGFMITFPLVKGDHCHLVFNERSIDKFQTGGGEDTDPVDTRMHNLSDAVAYVGFYPDSKALPDADSNNMVIGKSGSTQIHVADGKIELGEKASADKVSLDSKIQIELARIASELSALTIFIAAHGHSGVTTGAGVSGPPVTPPPTPGSPAATASALVTIKE